MTAFGYIIDRVVGLTCYPILVLLFLSQILSYKWANPKPPRIKLNIHYLCLCSSVLMTLYCVDELNMFGIFPHSLYLLVLNLSVSSVSGTLCLIIYCHFELQYHVDLKPVPSFIGRGLFMSWAFFSTLLLTLHMLMNFLNKVVWDVLWEITAMVYLLTILGIDLAGYFTVRKALSFSKRSETEFAEKLKRITRFHIFIHVAVLGFISDCPYWIVLDLENGWDASENWYTPDVYNDPDVQVYFFLVALICYLWWAWIPYRKKVIPKLPSKSATTSARKSYGQRSSGVSLSNESIISPASPFSEGTSDQETSPSLSPDFNSQKLSLNTSQPLQRGQTSSDSSDLLDLHRSWSVPLLNS